MTDILLLSLGTTRGLRAADASFADMLRAAGATVELARVRVGAAKRLQRFYPATDLVEIVAARRAAETALRRHDPRAVVVSTTTAAMLAPLGDRPYAVRFDAPAALNRPGRRNAIQHALERRRMRDARLLLPLSRAAERSVPLGNAPSVIVPMPIAASGPSEPVGRVAVAYTPDPKAKGLDILGEAWGLAAIPDARLLVFGMEGERGRSFLARYAIPVPARLEWRGTVPREEFRAALRRAHVLVTSARWEDWGQAQLEALADGALLATTPAGGPYEALAFARELDPRLVAGSVSAPDLAEAIGAAFAVPADEADRYRRAAAGFLEPFGEDAIQAAIEREVLPALLG
jgi:glycosyltransferase involved in cell wall biosynthesis